MVLNSIISKARPISTPIKRNIKSGFPRDIPSLEEGESKAAGLSYILIIITLKRLVARKPTVFIKF